MIETYSALWWQIERLTLKYQLSVDHGPYESPGQKAIQLLSFCGISAQNREVFFIIGTIVVSFIILSTYHCIYTWCWRTSPCQCPLQSRTPWLIERIRDLITNANNSNHDNKTTAIIIIIMIMIMGWWWWQWYQRWWWYRTIRLTNKSIFPN